MGAQASEELTAWVAASDLALVLPRMRVLPTLNKDCQVEAVRRLWRSLHWMPAGEVLLARGDLSSRLFVIVRGEVEVVLGNSSYIPLLPAGCFFCEAALLSRRDSAGQEWPTKGGARPWWPLRRWRRIPAGAVGMIEDFLAERGGPRFQGRVRTTQRSLVATLTRQELAAIVKTHGGADAAHALDGTNASCNVLQNVIAFGSASAHTLGAQDLAALRVVCEGPLRVSCQGAAAPVLRGLCGACMGPSSEPR
mmetsp:Transcript_54448/g.174582  ORF Transcript_54448/g.174582 Transcript_54448/m.174582 type:complete len:251 (-) Transcript_54448:72-824(-)